MKKTLLVEGMSCGHCVKAVENAVKELKDIHSVSVNLDEKKVEVSGENLNDNELKEVIEDAGYDVLEIN